MTLFARRTLLLSRITRTVKRFDICYLPEGLYLSALTLE